MQAKNNTKKHLANIKVCVNEENLFHIEMNRLN